MDSVNFLSAHFEGGVYFTSSSFKQNACFTGVIFHSNANFDHAKFQFGEDCKSKSIANFSGAHFQKTAELNATFGHDASFREAIFDDNAKFDDAEFLQKAIFCGTQFKKDALFLNSAFQEADFSQGKFYQNAYFYGASFHGFPNFLQAIFNGDVNFTNTELNFDFEDTRKKIEKIYNERKDNYDKQQDKNSKEKPPKKHKIANEFRDSFRNIKSSLIENHNMLDASNYHRVELYCKELELEYKREIVDKSTTRDFVDRIQLYCYRVTSDHHTDLMLILNNVVFLIALFGIISLGLVLFTTSCTVEKLINQAVNIKTLEIFIVNAMFISIALCSMLHCCFDFLKCIRDTLRNIFYTRDTCIFLHIFAAIIVCILFAFIAIFVYFIKIKYMFSYFIVALMFIFNPSSILPILGKLIDNKDSKYCYCNDLDIFGVYLNESLNLIYMLFLFLLLWSLQKTARKNTIVPN